LVTGLVAVESGPGNWISRYRHGLVTGLVAVDTGLGEWISHCRDWAW